MSNSDKSSTNGVTDPLQRLASMKPPRDLSLGGIKPNKKVFTPNLNVSRSKNKGPSSGNSRDQKKDDKNKKDTKFDKNKFVSKNGPKIIKSSGVFSEGLGSVEKQVRVVSYEKEAEPTSILKKPTIKVNNDIKIDNELEEEKIKESFGDDSFYNEESEDFRKMLDVEAPVKLPMDDGGLTNLKTVKIKPEVVIKTEPSEDCASPILEEPMPDVKEVFEDTNVVNLLKSDTPTLILLQMTDTLPGRGADDDSRRRQDQPSTSDEMDEQEEPVDSKCRLRDLEEGKIGKLRVHRSGRVTLALGDTVFEVCKGTKASFYQEVVSVAVDEPSRSAGLVSLGPLQHKLNITPHWQTLFNNMSV